MLGKNSRICFVVSLGIMVVSIVLMVWAAPMIIRRQIQKNVQIENSSQMFEKWRKLPIPLDFKIYVFNVTNVDDVNKGRKPALTEIGPYVYKQYREKMNLTYGANDTVKYMLKKSYYFDSNESGILTEDDEVTVINFSYLAAIHSVNDLVPAMLPTLNGGLEVFFSNLTDPFLRVKVRDLFFDGVFLNCVGESMALSLVCGQIKSDKTPTMRPADDETGFYFSMFGHLNRTETGPYEMVRGRENVYNLGNIVSYKGQYRMTSWGNQYCNQLNGSDSSIFPPIDESNVPKRMYTFEPDICRSLYASLVDKRSIFNMDAYYYEIDSTALASKSAVPDNKCFCKKNWSGNHDGCLLMGILNLEPCQGAPAIASLPHFYMASEELLEYFDGGVNPDKNKHNTYLYIDPITGVVLKGVKRLQFNIELRNLPNIPQLSKVRTGLFPLLWIEEGAELTTDIQEELQSSHSLIGHVKVMTWILLALSLVAVVGSMIAVVKAGALPFWPRNNTVSFILRPTATASATNKVN